MTEEKTLLLIKPDIIKKKKIGKIISIIEENNITIESMKMIKFEKEDAEIFYEEHKNKEFFNELINFMTSDKIIALILSGDNIIERVRLLIGNTNYKKAEKNTIRYYHATTLTENAVHASDSIKSAIKEINFINKFKI